mgnify:CR=1 FL=1
MGRKLAGVRSDAHTGPLYINLQAGCGYRTELEFREGMNPNELRDLSKKLTRVMHTISRTAGIFGAKFSHDRSENQGTLEYVPLGSVENDCVLLMGDPQLKRDGENWTGIEKLNETQVELLSAIDDKGTDAITAMDESYHEFKKLKAKDTNILQKTIQVPALVGSLIRPAVRSVKIQWTKKTDTVRDITCQDFGLLFMKAPSELLNVLQKQDD